MSLNAAAEPFVERRKRTGRREAYEIYQRGHHEWQTLQRHRMQDGLQLLTHAVELDPSLVAAKVDLVNLCIAQSFYGFMSPTVAADLVRRAADLGIPSSSLNQSGVELGSALDSAPGNRSVLSGGASTSVSGKRTSLPGATFGLGRKSDIQIPNLPLGAEAILPALGWINFHVDHNLPPALHAFSITAHLPHDAWITRLRVMFALSRHRFDEAIELMRAALQLDPYSPSLHARLAWALHLASQPSESVKSIHRALELFPDSEDALLYGTVILAFNSDAQRATELAENLVQRSPHFDLATAAHAYALACAGRADEARTLLERLQWLSRERFVLCSFTPAVHLALGNQEAAISELRSANDVRCPWFFQMLADPRLKPLQTNSEFRQLRSILTRMEASAEIPEPEL